MDGGKGDRDDRMLGEWHIGALHNIAQKVVRIHPGLLLEHREAHDIALVAILELLEENPEADAVDLYREARHAVTAANQKEASYKGLKLEAPKPGERIETRIRWNAYWYGQEALSDPFEEIIVERIAARQVWDALTAHNRQTFFALISQGTYEGAEAYLGLTKKQFSGRISKARKQARQLWFSPEPPARHWARDYPGQGHTSGRENIARRRVTAKKKAA